jgi:hypothetical protein
VSLLAPAERLARKMQRRLKAMQAKPPSQAQLDYLKALGDTLGTPESMAVASERIDQLSKETPRQQAEAQADVQEHIDNQGIL